MIAWITKYGWTSTAWTTLFFVYAGALIVLAGFIATS